MEMTEIMLLLLMMARVLGHVYIVMRNYYIMDIDQIRHYSKLLIFYIKIIKILHINHLNY